MPSAVFAPYMDEGGEALRALASELDAVFADLAARAAGLGPAVAGASRSEP